MLDDSKVKSILEETESKFPGIFDLNLDEEIAKLEKELEEQQKIEKKYDKIEKELKNLEEFEEKNKNRREMQTAQELADKEVILDKTLVAAKTLETLEQENHKLYEELKVLYTQKQKNPEFMFQMNLNRLKKNWFEFQTEMDNYLKKDPLMKPSQDPKTFETNVCHITSAKDSLLRRKMELLNQELNDGALEKVIEMKDLVLPRNGYEISAQLMDVEAENIELEILVEGLLAQVNNEIEKFVTMKVESVLTDFNKQKLLRAEKRIDRFSTLKDLLNDFVNSVVVILVSLETEKEKCNFKRPKMFNETNKRILLMQNLGHRDVEEELDATLTAILQTFLSNFESDLPELMVEFNDKLKDLTKEINLIGESLDWNQNLIESLQKSEVKLKKLLYDGPINRVQVVNPKIYPSLKSSEVQLAEFDEHLRRLKEKYLTEYQQPRSKDRFIKIKSRLWYWFLTEPIKVIESIKQISEAAKNIPQQQEKVISGIRRQI